MTHCKDRYDLILSAKETFHILLKGGKMSSVGKREKYSMLRKVQILYKHTLSSSDCYVANYFKNIKLF